MEDALHSKRPIVEEGVSLHMISGNLIQGKRLVCVPSPTL